MQKILVIDDEFEIAATVGAILQDEGYEVRTISAPPGAWQVICEMKPDLILLDMMMPVIGGLELLKRLRSTREFQRTPVILMSAVQPRARQEVGGWNEFLHKPFTLYQLVEAATRLLQRGSSEADEQDVGKNDTLHRSTSRAAEPVVQVSEPAQSAEPETRVAEPAERVAEPPGPVAPITEPSEA